MDDLIYGLLVIAWVVYGIYSAAKKNKAKAKKPVASPPASTQTKDTIEAVFESFFQDSSPDPLATPHPYSQADYIEENIEEEVMEYEEIDYLDSVPETSVESKIDTYSGSDNVEASIIIEEEMDEIQKSAIDSNEEGVNPNSYDFDLRQAVIAQAVLERPYE